MARPHRALLVAILVLAFGIVPAAVATAQTPAGTPSATASPARPPAAGGLSPAAIVVGLVLIGGTLLLRTRMGRADR